MANLILHKLIKNKSSLRIITTLNHTLPQTPSLLISNKTHIDNTKSDPKPLLNPTTTTTTTTTTQPLHVYPNFPFGYSLNPISSTGFHPLNVLDAGDVESNDEDDARTVWADSVKKKRKKKMNKHKYKKLRKRLRRKA